MLVEKLSLLVLGFFFVYAFLVRLLLVYISHLAPNNCVWGAQRLGLGRATRGHNWMCTRLLKANKTQSAS